MFKFLCLSDLPNVATINKGYTKIQCKIYFSVVTKKIDTKIPMLLKYYEGINSAERVDRYLGLRERSVF